MKEQYKNLPICDITPFTMQDFPDHTACILWFGGCNFRCAYCHNPELVTGKKSKLPMLQIDSFLKSRIKLLDGVVLSGGECTLSKDLPLFIKYLKEFGYKIKLDTNGSNPVLLEKMLSDNLLDYIALDYKAPKSKFANITKWNHYEIFHKSLEILCSNNVAFEVRTTIHTDMLDQHDIEEIIKDLTECGFSGTYYLQNYIPSKTLATIEDQEFFFDPKLLTTPKNFKIDIRNF